MSDPSPPQPLLVGHKGAAHIEPGNTTASFDAALRLGVDMIELDVLSEHPDGSGRSSWRTITRTSAPASPLTFEQALEHLSGERVRGDRLDVDVKLPGYELRVLEALREFELIPRTLISGMYPAGLDTIRAAEPSCAWAGRCPGCVTTTPPTCSPRSPRWPSSPDIGRCSRGRARRALLEGRFDAVMAHWRVATAALLRAVRDGGGQLYVWTVDDPRRIAELTAMGVDGIITNDPRLFKPITTGSRARPGAGPRRRG